MKFTIKKTAKRGFKPELLFFIEGEQELHTYRISRMLTNTVEEGECGIFSKGNIRFVRENQAGRVSVMLEFDSEIKFDFGNAREIAREIARRASLVNTAFDEQYPAVNEEATESINEATEGVDGCIELPQWYELCEALKISGGYYNPEVWARMNPKQWDMSPTFDGLIDFKPLSIQGDEWNEELDKLTDSVRLVEVCQYAERKFALIGSDRCILIEVKENGGAEFRVRPATESGFYARRTFDCKVLQMKGFDVILYSTVD